MDGAQTPLRRYELAMHRSRTIYLAVLAVVLVALGVVVAIVWTNGEVAHATLHTASAQPANLELTTPSPEQSRAWQTTDRTGLGVPVREGTVITYSEHTVSGRNARTGVRTWTYTRTDRSVCNVIQIVNTTVVVFDRGGNCDELDAFDTSTGKRMWDRTLDENGQPLNGRPNFAYYGSTLMITSPSVIYAIDVQGDADVQGGVDAWTYSRYGCRIEHAVLGAAGALISQNCTSVRCKDIAKCGKGRQLFLRSMDPLGDTSKKNFDHIIWNDLGNTGVPVSADVLISAVQPGSNVLDRLDASTGKQLGTVELTPAPSNLGDITATQTDSAELIWIDGRLTAVAQNATAPLWSVVAAGPPSVLDTNSDDPPVLSEARITIATTAGIAVLDYRTGRASSTFDVGTLPAKTRVLPMGSGFLVSRPDGTVAYR